MCQETLRHWKDLNLGACLRLIYSYCWHAIPIRSWWSWLQEPGTLSCSPVYWELFVGPKSLNSTIHSPIQCPKYKMILDEGQIRQNDYYEISLTYIQLSLGNSVQTIMANLPLGLLNLPKCNDMYWQCSFSLFFMFSWGLCFCLLWYKHQF